MKYLTLLWLLLLISPAWAQETQFEVEIAGPLIYTSDEIASVYWTHDSRGLIFETKPILPNEVQAQWYSAVLQPDGFWRIDTTTMDDFQSHLLDDAVSHLPQKPIFGIKRGVSENGEGIIVASPNLHYIAYVGERQVMREGLAEGNGPITGYPLVLVDVWQNRSIIVPEVMISDLRNANLTYQINWSFDGTALTVATQSNFGAEKLYYVSSYATNLADVQTTRLRSLEINGVVRGVAYPFAGLSSDGKQLLFESITQTSDSLRADIFLWDVERPENSRILVENESIVTAAFSPDEGSVLFIGRDGLQRLDLKTQEITLIDATLNRKTVARAWFSPDRQRISIIKAQGDAASLLVVKIP